MATTGVVNATDLAFYVSGTAIGHAQNATISISHETRDVSGKDTGTWVERAPGQLSWSGSGSALFAYDATEGFSETFADITGRTKVEVYFSTEASGDNRYYGDIYFTELTANSDGVQENTSYDFSFEGTGAISEESVT